MSEVPELVEDDEELIGKILQPRKRAFLKAICMTPNIVKAAAVSGIDRDNHYVWMRKDPEYKAAFAVAWSRGIDAAEAEVVRRAIDGVKKPVFRNGKRALDFVLDHEGNPVMGPDGKPKAVPAVVVEHSDTLLMFLLNGQRSKVYRRGALETGDGPGSLNINQTNITANTIGAVQATSIGPPVMSDRQPDQIQKLMDLVAACKDIGMPIEIPEAMIPLPDVPDKPREVA